MSVAVYQNRTRKSQVRQLQTLYRLLTALTRARAPEDINEAAITSLLAATSADRAAILAFDADGVMRFKASRGLSAAYRDAVTGHSPWTQGTQDAHPVVVPDVLLDEELSVHKEIFSREGIRALAFIPLALEEGVFGKFMLYYAQPHEWAENEIGIAQAIASHVALAMDRQRAEGTLAESEQRLQAILDNSAAVIFLKDLQGRYVLVNRRHEQLFSNNLPSVIGRTDHEIFSPETAERFRENDRRVLAEARSLTVEENICQEDGIHTYISTKFPLRNADGSVSGVCGIATDITGRKQAEEERGELLAREQEARKTAELLNKVSSKLAVELNPERLTQVVTDVATALAGAEFGAFFHNIVNEHGDAYMLYTLSGVPREAFVNFPMPRSTGLFGPTYRGEGIVRSDDVTKDNRYGKSAPYFGMPKGHLPVKSYLAVPVVSRSGEVMGGLFLGHSVPGKFTAEHEAIIAGVAALAAISMDNARLFDHAQRAQAELKRSNEELRRANQNLETFAYSASHDLQEPLRNIALSAQLMERRCGKQLPTEADGFLSSILKGASRMKNLIDDLLVYVNAGKAADGPTPRIDSATVLATVLEDLKTPVEESKGIVTHGTLPPVYMHETRLAQVFQNLINNALKYRSKEVPRIHVSADERDGWSTFSVSDNGIGIEPQYADQIFKPFKRLHSREQYAGSGIGLGICQRIVELYGGRIWLEKSVPGEGSTFCFSVPAERQ